ncbi:MAG TPA: hypothetical protein VID04_04450 [Methylomirabilota bacterium]
MTGLQTLWKACVPLARPVCIAYALAFQRQFGQSFMRAGIRSLVPVGVRLGLTLQA